MKENKVASEIVLGVLGKILKLNEEEIINALSLTKDYKIVKVPKKRGGYRTLYIPPEPVKKSQKRILNLLYRMFFKEYGIYREISSLRHAKEHRYSKWVFQFDLKDAFSSINVSHIKEILQNEFLTELNDFEISLKDLEKAKKDLEKAKEQNDEAEISFMKDFLNRREKEIQASIFSPIFYSTDLPQREWVLPQKEAIAQGLADLVLELTTYQGILPQGTPTAPFLFYLTLVKGGLIEKLNSVCRPSSLESESQDPSLSESQDRYKFHLSVYVDNFVISAQKPIPSQIQKEIFKIIEKFGLEINPKKNRHERISHGPIITGLRILPEGKVVLPKRKVRKIRGLIHRAIFDPSLRPKVQGIMASLRPIYGTNLPSQIEKPYKLFQKILQ